MPDLDLQTAQRLIIATARPRPTESIPLAASLDRVTALGVGARLPVPHFDQALMDGFAITGHDLDRATDELQLTIVGEIAAGRTHLPRLRPGQTLRIMTGGAVPHGAALIIPQEECREQEGRLRVPFRPNRRNWIRARGEILARGKVIVGKGELVRPEHLPLLATAGVSEIVVHQRPRAAVLSTGSELVEIGAAPDKGQVISGNPLLLDGLIRHATNLPPTIGMVPDRPGRIIDQLTALLAQPVDVIITTGGMGPGRYDLLPRVFQEMGVEILYRSLKIRPGKGTMAGVLGNTLLFALPGPPPAVRILFNELVLPALKKIHGLKRVLPANRRAVLTREVRVKRNGLQHLLAGVQGSRENTTTVRPAAHGEPADAIIVIPGRRRRVKAGELVCYHPA